MATAAKLDNEISIEKLPVEHPAFGPRGPRLHPAHRHQRIHMNLWEFLVDLARQTLANVRRNKLRSFLTLFGIAWGIASLVLMGALSDGFRQGQRNNMKQIGDNVVMLFPGRTERQAGGQRAGRQIRFYAARHPRHPRAMPAGGGGCAGNENPTAWRYAAGTTAANF